jgi:hypothetical protein
MRYLIGLLVTIGLLVLLIVIIVQGGGSSKSKVAQSTKTLESYSQTDAVARLTTDGPINAAQNHQQIQITVGRDNVAIATKTGYDGTVTNLQTYSNTEASYSAFLHALDHAGFTKGNPDAKLKDESGYCALGSRYIFEFLQDGKTRERFWATSCGKPKTYLGALDLSLTLFHDQVPDYNKIIVDFSPTI